MHVKFWLWLIVFFWVGVIYLFGRSGFGRANTQALIDKVKHHPALWAFLDRHHGKFRASFHYIEFGFCYAILYLALGAGNLRWGYGRGLAVWGITSILALLDEIHQKKRGGRCFRRIDLLHSILGAGLAMLLFFLIGFR